MGDGPYLKVGEVGTQSVQPRAPLSERTASGGSRSGPGAVSLRPRCGPEEADVSSAD